MQKIKNHSNLRWNSKKRKIVNVKTIKLSKDLVILLLLLVTICTIGYQQTRLEEDIENITSVATISKAVAKTTETIKEPVQEVKSVIADLKPLGSMEKAIKEASKEFGVPENLLIGIAHAESNFGKSFFHPYDYNCHNYWGLKGGNMSARKDGSYLRCFNDDVAGARTMAKTLKLFYINEGKDTPEKICQKWIGGKFAKTHCPTWVANVKKHSTQNL